MIKYLSFGSARQATCCSTYFDLWSRQWGVARLLVSVELHAPSLRSGRVALALSSHMQHPVKEYKTYVTIEMTH